MLHEFYVRLARTLPDGIRADLRRGHGPFAVLADGGQFHIMLEQLVENAVEAMANGGTLSLHVQRDERRTPTPTGPLSAPAGTYVVISVSDTGVGMTPEAVAVACDPFYSTKSPHLGAGMGLASVHGMVAAHSGGLAIESLPGHGTTVRLYLPAA
jgi:signal transduction histidine kinase